MSAPSTAPYKGVEFPLYPNVEVNLAFVNGNAFYLMGYVSRAMQKANLGDAAIEAFSAEATSGDYDHLLATLDRTVAIDFDDPSEDDEDGGW